MFKQWSIGIILVWLLSGCQSTLMEPVQEQALTNAANGNAQVIFMRSAFIAQAIQASVFDVTDGTPKFIGILSNDTKIAHEVTPGEHMFMVVGESADFLKANVLANKTYYTIATPRMGFWKARFSLFPVRNDATGKFEYHTKKFDGMLNDSKFVKSGPKAEKWARDNANSINQKLKEYLPEWLEKDVNKQQEATITITDHL